MAQFCHTGGLASPKLDRLSFPLHYKYYNDKILNSARRSKSIFILKT